MCNCIFMSDSAVIYCRISTAAQNVSSQLSAARKACSARGWAVEEEICDVGTGRSIERKGIWRLKRLLAGGSRLFVVWDLSRISRDSAFLSRLLAKMEEMGAEVFIASSGEFYSEMPEDRRSYAVGWAEGESSHIRQRMKRGYDEYMENGGKVGRKSGWRKEEGLIMRQNEDVAAFLASGMSVRKAMALSGKSSGLVMKIRKLLSEEGRLR